MKKRGSQISTETFTGYKPGMFDMDSRVLLGSYQKSHINCVFHVFVMLLTVCLYIK